MRKSYKNLSDIIDNKYDVIILAVAHNEFMALDIAGFKKPQAIVFDIKSALPATVADARL